MALVQLGSIVTDIKGKVGGSYFSGSLGGTALQAVGSTGRKRANGSGNPVYRTTQGGSGISACLLFVVRSWKNISAVNKAAWVAAAPNFPTTNKFGKPTKPSGYHTYVHINYSRAAQGVSLLSVPPSIDGGVLPTAITFGTCSSVALTVTVATAIPTGFLGIIRATRPLSAGLKPNSTMFTSIYWVAAGASGLQNLTTAYENRFGALITGNTVWVELQLSSTTTGVQAEPYLIGSVIS